MSHRRKPAVWILILLFAAASLGQAPRPADTPRFFPMAVWYGGGTARAPMLERGARSKKDVWRKDLQQIKALGFNTVRAWIDWASGQPAEATYDFETLDVLLELAEEQQLKLVLQIYMDSAPPWVGEKYPDSLFVSSGGQAIRPESSPGYCRDHPGVRAADVAFYAALAERAKRSPAFVGWDLWSEPHVINWANPTWIPNPEFCFCPHSVRRFRAWLQKKYGTIEALNTAWYRRYRTWDQVEPSRMSTILSYTDYIDWKAFIVDKLGEDLQDRYQAVKTVAPATIVTSHAAGVGLFASPHHWEGQADDWTMARQVDFYGTSFYPKHSAFVDRDVPWRAALLDFTRSFGYDQGRRGFWIGELQGGFGTIALNVSPTVTPEDLRIWTWSAIARGAKGINYYAWYPMSSGYESGGFGLINLDGTITARAKLAGSIARVVDQHQALLLDARPPRAEVAIVYNPLAHFVGGRQRAAAYGGPQGEVVGHRARFAARRSSRAVSEERPDRLRAHQPSGRRAPQSIPSRHPALSPDAPTGVRRGDSRVRAERWCARGRSAARLEQRAGLRVRSSAGPRPVGRRRRQGSGDRDGPERPHVHCLEQRRSSRCQQGRPAARPLVQGDPRTNLAIRSHRRALRGRKRGGGDIDIRQGANADARLLCERRVSVHAEPRGRTFLQRPARVGGRDAACHRRWRATRGATPGIRC